MVWQQYFRRHHKSLCTLFFVWNITLCVVLDFCFIAGWAIEWLKNSALFYVLKSTSMAAFFESLSNLLLFFQEGPFLNYSSLWVDLFLCCFWRESVFHVWKPASRPPLSQMEVDWAGVPAFWGQFSNLIIRNSSSKIKNEFTSLADISQIPSRPCCGVNVPCSSSHTSSEIHLQDVVYFQSDVRRHLKTYPSVDPFSFQVSKSPWIASSCSLVLTVEHPAVSPVDPGVSPSLQHFSFLACMTHVEKQVHLQSLQVSRGKWRY